jgi:hypothetical protein
LKSEGVCQGLWRNKSRIILAELDVWQRKCGFPALTPMGGFAAQLLPGGYKNVILLFEVF